MSLIHFPYEIFLIWTSFCPTFSYYFDVTLNPVANSSCMPCSGVKLDVTLKHVVSLYGGCVVFWLVLSSGLSLEIKSLVPWSHLESPALAWAANKIPDKSTLGVFHHVSHCIHVIKTRASYWWFGTWIINECENTRSKIKLFLKFRKSEIFQDFQKWLIFSWWHVEEHTFFHIC